MNDILDLTESKSEYLSPSSDTTTSTSINNNNNNNTKSIHYGTNNVNMRLTPINIDILQLHNITESKNYTCQAQNSFGLVVLNLSLVIKGNFNFIKFFNVFFVSVRNYLTL